MDKKFKDKTIGEAIDECMEKDCRDCWIFEKTGLKYCPVFILSQIVDDEEETTAQGN